MMKNLFVPESIKGYYLLTTRIIGFDVGKTSIKATQISCKGRSITIEKFFEEPIKASQASDYQEAAIAALKIIIEQLPIYDRIVSALPSSQAIFKELKLPFMGLATIQRVIAYEVEPLLPFALQDAVIDCIITKEIPEEKSSEVFVAAVQNQNIAQHLALFEQAGIQPEKITIDLFALYGLYQLIPQYAAAKGGVVLLEIEPSSTRMAYIYDGQLRSIRSLPRGLLDQSRAIAQKLQISEQEALEHIIRFGLIPDHDQTYIAAIKQAFTTFFNEIIFTLQSFAGQAKPAQSINKIIILGTSAAIQGLPELVTELSHIPAELFLINAITHTDTLAITAKTPIPQVNLISLAAALPNTTTASFDLRTKEFALSQTHQLLQQLITAALLCTLILAGLLGNTLWQIRKLKREAAQSQQEVIDTIKEHIKKIPDDLDSLEEVLAAAKNAINQDEKLWSAFSGSARSRF